jgi:hypothetical protein
MASVQLYPPAPFRPRPRRRSRRPSDVNTALNDRRPHAPRNESQESSYNELVRCKNCHYSLKRLTEHRCPECGAAFDPNDLSTFDSGRFCVWLTVPYFLFCTAGMFLFMATLKVVIFIVVKDDPARPLYLGILGSIFSAMMQTVCLSVLLAIPYFLVSLWLRQRSKRDP